MSRASAKGQRFERLMANWLKFRLRDNRIDIRPKNGTNDRGDIGGLFAHGGAVVVELKNHKEFNLSGWLAEAERERGNANAAYGIVIFKRPKETDPAKQYVLTDAETLVRLIENDGVSPRDAA